MSFLVALLNFFLSFFLPVSLLEALDLTSLLGL